MQLSHVLDDIATLDAFQHPRRLHRIIVFHMLWKNKNQPAATTSQMTSPHPDVPHSGHIAMSQNALPGKNMHRLIVIFYAAEKIK